MNREVLPYGSWPSPYTAARVASASIRLGELHRSETALFWAERRPAEEGRTAIVELPLGRPAAGPRDRLPPPFSARSAVHEYGGGAYCVHDGVLYVSSFPDGRIHYCPLDEPPQPLTVEAPAAYADLTYDHAHHRLLCVREWYGNDEEPSAAIVAIDLASSPPVEPDVLVSGSDFYSSPRPSADGRKLAWLTWSHPDMPWDATTLWLGSVARSGQLTNADAVAEGAGESIVQPRFSPRGELFCISDRDGWWNLHRVGDRGLEPIWSAPEELASPHWVFGQSNYALVGDRWIVTASTRDGIWRLSRFDLLHRRREEIETDLSTVHSVTSDSERAYFVGAAPRTTPAVLALDPETGEVETLYRPAGAEPEPDCISVGEPIRFRASDGETVHAFYYPAANPRCQGPDDELPPLLVKSHGGPTAATDNAYDAEVQFWTSRGFALVDVNYRGSTGYGREYRQRLEHNWGLTDVDDCCSAARYLAERGLVDSRRLAIRGGSAGGYTVLAALAFTDCFSAGASYYGVGDLEILARDTHKFESHYLDRLVGKYPQERQLYVDRSPIHAADRLSCPVIFFQGLQDKVVPPNQAETMVAALRGKGVPVAYVTFENEGHGFRSAGAQIRALEAELYFYSRVFAFTPADDLTTVMIHNESTLD